MVDTAQQDREPVGRRRDRGGRKPRAQDRLAEFEGRDDAFVMYFKERVYATFTGLAIVLVVWASGHAEADHAFFALVLGVLGITAAGFVSDVISHLAVHQEFPSGTELRILFQVAGGALGTVLIPGILFVLAWVEVISVDAALRASLIVYIVTLAVVGWFAVRRSHLIWWKQLLVLLVLIALALLVVLLQALGHSV
ncbi:hypothetical protein [Microbacterium rhizomatis]|uniref:hypothetical protein n=1 Tax=Microbacterium rhizomatis TaxID=1631477 RepID=UPI001B87B47B|nr:hypothetical protein [Microbacterium rhizomatis]